MSVTYAPSKLDTAVNDINLDIFVADQSVLEFDGIETDAKTRAKTATWIAATGDATNRKAVTVRIFRDLPTVVNPKINITVKMTTVMIKSDSVTGLDTQAGPLASGFFIEFPQNVPVTVTDLRKMIDEAYSLSFNSVTSGAPDSVVLGKLIFGTLTETLY